MLRVPIPCSHLQGSLHHVQLSILHGNQITCKNAHNRLLAFGHSYYVLSLANSHVYRAVTIHWTGLLDWNTGLDYWTGVFSFLDKLSIWFLKIFDTWRSQFFLKQS